MSGRARPRGLVCCETVGSLIDNIADYWPDDCVNRHWTVLDTNILELGAVQERFGALTCISVLEHIEDHRRTVENMLALLEPGGVLVLTCPYIHNLFRPNVNKRPDALYGQDLP